MITTASHEDFQMGNAKAMDEGLLVRFFYREREDKAQTLEAGRPIFKETEYIEIRVPGKRDAQVCRPAKSHDRDRFPAHYEAFKKRVELPKEGTALSEWPQVSRSQCEELAFLNIKTVEQLASTADGHLGQFHGGMTLKRRASEWLAHASKTKLIAENEALQFRLKEVEDKLAAMQEQLAVAAPAPAPAPLPPTPLDEPVAPVASRRRRKVKES